MLEPIDRLLVGLAAIIVAAAACSGTDTADTTTTTTTVAITPPTETTASTTTDPPTTTEDPIAAAEAAAVEPVIESERAWTECVADTSTCDIVATLADTTSGESLDVLTEVFETWKANGWVVRPPLDPEHDQLDIVGVDVVNEEATEAEVVSCRIDGLRLVDPNAGPDGSDVIVSDQIESLLTTSFVRLEADGVWRIYNTELIESFEGGDGCPDQSS